MTARGWRKKPHNFGKITQLKTGSFKAEYKNLEGKLKRKTFSTSVEAEDWLARQWKRKPGFGRLRLLPSGKFQASYTAPVTNPDGSPLIIKADSTFEFEDVAERWLSDHLHEIKTSELTGKPWRTPQQRAQSGMTVGGLIEEWLENVDVKPQTKQSYRGSLKKRVLENPIASEPVVNVDRARIKAWFADIKAEEGSTIASCRRAGENLLKAFKYAIEIDIVEAQPVHMSDAPKDRSAPEEKKDNVKPEEVRAIANNMEEQLKVPVLLMFWIALRIGELLDLRRKDIIDDGERMIVDISHAVYPVRNDVTGKHDLVPGSPKTKAGYRKITVPKKIADLMRNHLREFVGKEPEALIATDKSGNQIHTATFNGWFKRAAKAAGRSDLTTHDARHFGITMLVNHGGVNLEEAREQAGHRHASQTLEYLLPDKDYGLIAAANLDKLIP